MIFRHGGKAYRRATIKAYRTRDLDLVIVCSPPNRRWVFVVDVNGTHLASAAEIESLAAQHRIEELREPARRKAASAA